MTSEYMPALLISLIVLASIICVLVFAICAFLLYKFCFEKKGRKVENENDNCEKKRNRRLPTDDIKLCKKLLNQSEYSKSSAKQILKAFDSDLDSTESSQTLKIDVAVQTDETCFQQHNIDVRYKVFDIPNGYKKFENKNPSITTYKVERILSSNNQLKKPHSKSRVKVQIQNYISPNCDSNSLQITQAVVRRFSDNSPYKDDDSISTENYCRGRSSSQIPQTNKMSRPPSINLLNKENNTQYQTLVTPTTQRRGSHHLRPFDTYWNNNKLSHSMELVSGNQITSGERKVHSFDNALGKRRAISTQGDLYQAKSWTTSNSEEAASSIEEPHKRPETVENKTHNKYSQRTNSPKYCKSNKLSLNDVVVYKFTNRHPESTNTNFKQGSYQNFLEFRNEDGYKSRKSFVGEIILNSDLENDNQIQIKRVCPYKEQRIDRRLQEDSCQIQLKKDYITLNIINSESEKSSSKNELVTDEQKFILSKSCTVTNDSNLSPRNAADKRHQFRRERKSLIQIEDITEFQQMLETKANQLSSKDNDILSNSKQILERDYSIDERTSAIFNEFMYSDPNLDKSVMEAQILEKIRTQRKSNCSPIKLNKSNLIKLEYTKAASFAGNDSCKTYSKEQENISDEQLKCPQVSSYQQRRQSIGKLKVQSFDLRKELPVIILPDDSP